METQTINTPHNTVPVTPGIPVKPTVDLGHDKLLATLYFIFDAFERCGIEFFLVKDTAHKAMQERKLEGDRLDIGVRQLEWNNDQKDILFAYFDQERVEKTKDEPGIVEFTYQDIPFVIHLYEDNPCVTALVPIIYENEHWKIPNQFTRFEKEFDK